MNLPTIQKQTPRYSVQTCGCKGGGGGNVMDWKFGVSRCKLLHLECISNEVLLYITGNYIQSLGIEHDRRQYEKKNVYMCMTGSLCRIGEMDRTL